MKKIIIILSVFVALSLAGILYGTQNKSEEKETVSLEEAYRAQFPEQVSDMILHPMPGFPVY